MAISLICPGCGQKGRVPDDYMGCFTSCPKCGTSFRVSLSHLKAKKKPPKSNATRR
ncbi:MAG TPA: MJ0042-type zinc finger domain-containing protein [Gemmataceae bacterium]|nr:MJ0042-type zinc finger domain-containing protein [Gemmataceae bacterium]